LLSFGETEWTTKILPQFSQCKGHDLKLRPSGKEAGTLLYLQAISLPLKSNYA